jgi:hypothetical protein
MSSTASVASGARWFASPWSIPITARSTGGFYEKLGFARHPNPERIMQLAKPWPRDLP